MNPLRAKLFPAESRYLPGNRWLNVALRTLHLVGVAEEPGSDPDDLKLEHGAFRARGIDEFVARLDAAGERYKRVKVPGMPIVQINVWDPDGNHLHIDFHNEADA